MVKILLKNLIFQIIAVQISLLLLFSSSLSYSQINSNSTVSQNYEFDQDIELKSAKDFHSIIKYNDRNDFDKDQKSNFLESNMYFSKAKNFEKIGMFDSSVLYYKMAIECFKSLNDSIMIARSYLNIGATDYYYGNYNLAGISYDNALKYLDCDTDSLLLSKIYNNKALLHKSLGQYKDALYNFQMTLKYQNPSTPDLNKANTLTNIGVLYWELNSFDMALKYYLQSAKLFEINKDSSNLASVFNNIGLIYSHYNKSDSALIYFNNAIKLYDSENNRHKINNIKINLASLYEKNGDLASAEKLYLESYYNCKESEYANGIYISCVNLSNFYSNKGDFKKSLLYAEEAEETNCSDKPVALVAMSFLSLAKSYSSFGDYKSANMYYSKYIALSDSIFNLELSKEVTYLQIKYESEINEAKLETYKQQLINKDIVISNNETKLFLVSISVIILLILSLLIFRLYLQKKRSYLALVKQNLELAKNDIMRENADSEDVEKISASNNPTEKKYSEINLSDEQKREVLENLRCKMEKQKFFMNTQVTIQDLAVEINSNRYYLSSIINEHFGVSFTNYLNEYRIKEARKMLINPLYSNYSIEGIAQMVGFYNKVTFNNAFKKFTGVTPSFFKENYDKFDTDVTTNKALDNQ